MACLYPENMTRYLRTYLKALKTGLQEPVPHWELPVLLVIAVIDFSFGLGWLRVLFIAAVVIAMIGSFLKR